MLALAGCTLYHGGGGDDVCNKPVAAGEALPAQQLLNPETLQCQTFSQGPTCDPTCGPCPALEQVQVPSWGSCSSACDGLDQPTCATTSGCRIALDWAKYYTGASDAFIGCFATDMNQTGTPLCKGLDAQDCSRVDSCTALYQQVNSNCGTCAQHEFQECIPEGQQAGSCTGQVLCDLAVSCPAGTTPGIEGSCYTGSCIPDQFCPVSGGGG